jgi:hypothetical protein
VIVLSGLSETNGAKLMKEGAAAFFGKSEKLFENNSADLVAAVNAVLGNVNDERPVTT